MKLYTRKDLEKLPRVLKHQTCMYHDWWYSDFKEHLGTNTVKQLQNKICVDLGGAEGPRRGSICADRLTTDILTADVKDSSYKFYDKLIAIKGNYITDYSFARHSVDCFILSHTLLCDWDIKFLKRAETNPVKLFLQMLIDAIAVYGIIVIIDSEFIVMDLYKYFLKFSESKRLAFSLTLETLSIKAKIKQHTYLVTVPDPDNSQAATLVVQKCFY